MPDNVTGRVRRLPGWKKPSTDPLAERVTVERMPRIKPSGTLPTERGSFEGHLPGWRKPSTRTEDAPAQNVEARTASTIRLAIEMGAHSEPYPAAEKKELVAEIKRLKLPAIDLANGRPQWKGAKAYELPRSELPPQHPLVQDLAADEKLFAVKRGTSWVVVVTPALS